MLRLITSILLSITFILLFAHMMSNISSRLFNVFIGMIIGVTVSYLAPESIFEKMIGLYKKILKK